MRWVITFILVFMFSSGKAFAAPPPVEAYAQLPAVWDAAVSPDGKDLAVILENDGEYIIRVFNIADPSDKTVRATGIGKDIRPQWIKWVNNDRLLLSVGKTQFIDTVIVNTGYIFTIPRDVSSAEILIKPKNKKRTGSRFGSDMSGVRQFNNVVVDFLPDDPDHILMAFSDEVANAPGVQKVNVTTGSYTLVRRGSSNIQHWVSDLRGEVRVGTGRTNIGDDYTLIIRAADSDDWDTHKDFPGIDGSTNVWGFTENPIEMIVARYGDSDTLGLFIYDLSQKRFTRKLFQHDTYDVDDIVLSPDGNKVIGAQYIADTPKIEFFDPDAKNRMDKAGNKLAGYTLTYYDQTPDGEKVILKAHAPDVPSNLLIYTVSNNQWTNLGSDYPKLNDFEHAAVQSVRYTARDGEKIPSYITLPPKVMGSDKVENVPFIIMPHGGPYARDTATFDYIAQFLASRGYGVLQMNFRGSEGYGKSFKDAGRKNWVMMQEDVTDGARWLIEKGYADKDRICIMGWSYGGYAALMGAVKHSDMYTCAVSIAGVTDLQELITDQKKYRFGDRFAKEFIKQGFDGNSDMRDNSPVRRADEITIPVFLAHGTMDVNVHFDHFKRMKSALKKNKNVVTLELKDADHSVRDGANRVKMFKAIDKFLQKHLGESEYAP
jgi:dipeptidyl aminopeptidase/acylaminoacyl peptidase